MPTIGIWVDEETYRKWKALNENNGVGTKKLKARIVELIEENREWIEWRLKNPDGTILDFLMEKFSVRKEASVQESLDVSVSDEEVLAEIF